jgi:Tfp pilus assembly protein PilF
MLFKNYSYYPILVLMILLMALSACQMSPTKQAESKKEKVEVSSEVRQKYAYALQLMGAGNDDAALKMFNSVSQLNDGLSGPYVNRGLIYLRADKKKQAEQQFRAAINRNAENVTALNQLGVLLREKKEFKAARKNYEAALAVDNTHANAHLNLGVLCDIYLQDKPCAMKHFQTYIKLKGEDETVANWIVDLQEQL